MSRNPQNDRQRLIEAVNKLELPGDVRQKILAVIKDPPPPSNCPTINDAMIRGVLCKGLPDETFIQKQCRVCFYGLVYFPRGVIVDHHFLTFANGRRIQENSQETEVFRRNSSKHCEKAILDYKMKGVFYRRVNASDRSISGSGFRLTVSGEDSFDQINVVLERKAAIATNRHIDALDESRITEDMISDPIKRKALRDMKVTVKEFAASPQIRALLEAPARAKQAKQAQKDQKKAKTDKIA